MAKLEGAKECMAFSSGEQWKKHIRKGELMCSSSGMAAANAVVEALLKQGDHIVASKQVCYNSTVHTRIPRYST